VNKKLPAYVLKIGSNDTSAFPGFVSLLCGLVFGADNQQRVWFIQFVQNALRVKGIFIIYIINGSMFIFVRLNLKAWHQAHWQVSKLNCFG